MRPGTPQHPFGHGPPLNDQDRARLQLIAQRHADDLGPLLRWPAAAPAVGAAGAGRRILRPSGWPAWLALLLGLALIDWGARADLGWPLLAGTVLAVTFNHWLGLPRHASLPAAVRTASRQRSNGPS